MTVTFDMNGQGTAPESQSIGYGGKVAKPTNPTAGGFTFDGWYKDADCTEAWNFNTDKVTEDTTLYAQWTMGTGLWVGENYIPATASLSGEGWSYDLDTNTLTLNGFTYSGKGHKYNGGGGWRADHAVIYYEGEEMLNLVLSGENVITNTFAGDDLNTWVYGIFANKALTISGEGSLTISMTGSIARESYGIYSVNEMAINGGILNVTAGTTKFNSCAFKAQSGRIIINGGTIEAHGGLSDYNYSYALDCFSGYDDETKIGLQINSLNTLVATGERQAINFALDTACAGTGWTNVEGTVGEAAIAVGHYQDSGVTSFKKVEFVGATLVTIEIANKEINYNEDAPTYTYVTKIDDVTVTDENLLSAVATKLTIGSSYTKGSDAGEYDIVNSNASYNEKFNVSGEDYMISSVVKGTLTVKKIDAVVTAPTAKTDLHYTGEAQKLINAGSTTGGTLQYSLDGVNYSEEIPEATNVGEYTIYYKVVGDTNYKDVEVKSFKVSILENDKVTLNSVIDSVGAYYNSIKDGHPTVASDLLDAINAAKAVKDNANKTIQEIENAANTLTNALKAAEVEVAKNLITAIGEVELTQDCKDKIDAASPTKAEFDATVVSSVHFYRTPDPKGVFAHSGVYDSGTQYFSITDPEVQPLEALVKADIALGRSASGTT